MRQHQNAKLTPRGRAEMVRRLLEDGESPKAVATALGLCVKTVRKWVERYQEHGAKGLKDRRSVPRHLPTKTARHVVAQIESWRRQRLDYDLIAQRLEVSKATVCRVLRQKGLNRLSALAPVEPVVRYERAHPGKLIHFDIKKLARIELVGHGITGQRGRNVKGAGWEFLHFVIDDHSRIAFAALMPNERQDSAIAFLHAAMAFYAKLGIKPQRIMTDNGACYQATAFVGACTKYGVRHLRTRPYRPQTNGKAERFIQTITRKWAHGCAYRHSDERQAHLLPWLHRYNWHRPHSSLNRRPPISRLRLSGDNLLRLHS
ncbi:IS481 family transposase [Opitutaceae bacterium]|nr:IS481 family transposase [Opitutaceae bacterium]